MTRKPSRARRGVIPNLLAVGLLAAILLIGGAPATSSPADAQSTEWAPEPLPEDNLLFLEARLGGLVLSDFFLLYQIEDRNFMPLGEITAILDFAIEVDPEAHRAAGWFINPDNTFDLDLDANSVTIRGEAALFDPAQISLDVDEIYVTQTLLEAWFPLTFGISYENLHLTINPDKPLPFQARAERHRKWEEFRTRGGGNQVEPTDFLKVPAATFSLPNIGIQARQGYIRQTSTKGYSGNLNLQLRNDLFGARFNGNASIAKSPGDARRLSSTRLELHEFDEDPVLLGPLKARRWSLGDTNGPTFPLIGTQSRGRGVAFSSRSSSSPSNIGSETIEGIGIPGYDVELYLNNRLTDFQTIGDDGEYRFEDVDLLRGVNEFRILFYGPRGEREERVERIIVGPGLISEGEFSYDFAAFESQDPIVRGSRPASEDREPSALLTTAYGVNDLFTLTGGFYAGPTNDALSQAINLGARFPIGEHFIQTDGIALAEGQTASGLTVQSRFDGFSTRFSSTYFTGYEAEENRTIWDTDATLQHSLGDLPVNIGWSAGHRSFIDTAEQYRFSNTTTVNLRPLALSNRIGTTVSKGVHYRDNLSGALTARAQFTDFTVRSALDYDIGEDPGPTRLNLSTTYSFEDDVSTRMRVGKSFDRARTFSLSGEISKRFERFDAGFEFSGDSEGNRQFGLVLRTRLIRDASAIGYDIRARNVTEDSATLHLEAFEDQDADGVLDPDEPLLPGTVFNLNGRSRSVSADENGEAVFYGLNTRQPSTVAIDRGSLPDVFMQPVHELVSADLRPASVARYRFAVQHLGTVDGTITLEGEPVGGAVIRLIDKNGTTAAETVSEFDGFFLIEGILPGRYDVEVEDKDGMPLSDPQTLAEFAFHLDPNDPYGYVELDL